MSEKISRALLLIDSVLFLIPLALISLVAMALTISIPQFAVPLIAFAIVQILAWRVVASFLANGRQSLVEFNSTIFTVLTIAAFFVLFALFVSTNSDYGFSEFLGGFEESIDVGVWGLPALVPFIHLSLERHFYLIREDYKTDTT